jgi:hypothetical protein
VTLTRSDTGAILGSGTPDKTGKTAIPFNAPAGTYWLLAQWTGDANYGAGIQTITNQIITRNTAGTKAVNLSLNLGSNSFSLGQRTAFTVTLTPAEPGSTAVPIGYVALSTNNGFNYGFISGDVALTGGRATGTLEWDKVGAQSVYAVYGGDSNYTGANSAPVTVNVAQAVPQLQLQAEATRIGAADQTSITASLINPLASTHAPVPTGTIQFFDSVDGGQAQPIGVPQAVVGGNGGSRLATLPLTLAKGKHLITAAYSGDVNWKTAVSSPVAITVSKR